MMHLQLYELYRYNVMICYEVDDLQNDFHVSLSKVSNDYGGSFQNGLM